MYIEHLRNEFYDVLVQSRPLIIAAPDVDSVCAVKILQHLFDLDGVAYTLISAEGYQELKEHFSEFRDKVKNVVLINCGGTVDILNLLEYPQDVIIFILDSHRPTNILNIYDDTRQVRIVTPPGESEDIPGFDDIFRYDENIESDSDNNSEEEMLEEETNGNENGRKNVLSKRKERHQWNQRRKRIIFEYSQYSYFGAPASIIMLEVAWTMSRGGHELVWYAIVGLTDYYALHKMDRQNYVLLANQLQSHVSRLNHSQQEQRDAVKLSFENDVCLHLYRHWTLYDSLAATPYFAVKFKFWLGENNLNRFLLDVGLPLNECRQKFVAMDFQIRKNFKSMLQKKSDKWNLEDITVPSFTRQTGMKRKFGALDSHLAALATLETSNGLSLSDRFKAALDTLPSDRLEDLDSGVEKAKELLQTIHQQVQGFLETNSVQNAGPFLLATVNDGTSQTKMLSYTNSLSLLSRFTLMAVVEASAGRRRQALPLILMAPQNEDVWVVIGIPPLAVDSTSNLFGKAFERVAESIGEGMAMNFFDTHIAQIRFDHKKSFLEKLMEIME